MQYHAIVEFGKLDADIHVEAPNKKQARRVICNTIRKRFPKVGEIFIKFL